jgi:iron(III) transport system substrate-binding protein
LKPELKDKIVSADPSASSSAFCQLTNMLLAMGGYESEDAWKYVENLFKNINGKVVSSSSAVYKGVYNGEYVVGLTYEDPCVTLLKNGATNIKVIYPVEGTVFLPAQIGIVKNAKNLANAQAFVDFMLSEEAQVFLAENTTSRPIRTVEAGNDYMTPMSDIKLIFEDSDYVTSHTAELKQKVQDIMMGI